MPLATFAARSFVTHSVPDLAPADHLVALCTIPQDYCHEDALQSHLADFAAFKHLFSGGLPPGRNQAWLSACRVGRATGVLRHGTKDVRSAVGAGVEVETCYEDLMKSFLQRVGAAGEAIRANGNSAERPRLFVLVCGPTTPHQEVLCHLPCPLSTHDDPILLHPEKLREHAGAAVDLIFITPNMHAGGWIVNTGHPNGDATMAARRTARNVAPLFVDSSVRILLKKSSPMLLIPENSDKTLTVQHPSRDQVHAKARFYNAVHEGSFSFGSSAPRMHALNFSDELDEWTRLCGPRRGPPLDEYYRVWRDLPSHGQRCPIKVRFPAYCFGVTKLAQFMHIKVLAFALKPSWTRDPADSDNIHLLKTLTAAFLMENTAVQVTEEQVEQVFVRFIQASVYRTAALNFADAVASHAGLEPSYPACRQWASGPNASDPVEESHPGLKERVIGSLKELLLAMPEQTPRAADSLYFNPIYGSEADRFEQPLEYLWSAMTAQARQASDEDDGGAPRNIERSMCSIEDAFEIIRHDIPEELLTSPWIASAGYSVIKSLDRKANGARLRAGLLTGLSTGLGPMPSEIMRVNRLPRSFHTSPSTRPRGSRSDAYQGRSTPRNRSPGSSWSSRREPRLGLPDWDAGRLASAWSSTSGRETSTISAVGLLDSTANLTIAEPQQRENDVTEESTSPTKEMDLITFSDDE